MMVGIDLDSTALAEIESADDRKDAVEVLLKVFDERAGEEALMRAVMAERNDDRKSAKFWVSIYHTLCSFNLDIQTNTAG